MKILEIIAIIGVIFSILYIGVFLFNETNKEEQTYRQIMIKINNDINPNMSKVEIHNVITTNCQNMMYVKSEKENCIYIFKNMEQYK